MDLFQEAQKLATAAKDIVQDATKNVTESIEEAKSAASELSSTATIALDHLIDASLKLEQQSSETFDLTVNTVKTGALEIATSGIEKAEELRQQSQNLVFQGFEAICETIDIAQGTAVEIGVTALVISDALKDLPKTAEKLAQEMPKIAFRLRHRVGLRVGDASRSDVDVMQLFEKIPGTSKLGANETKIREFLANKHGSHVISRQQGGSNEASNILWEIGSDNIRRGARIMTGSEQVYIRFYNAIDSIVKNSGTIAKLGVTATGTAVLTQTVLTALSYTLDLYRGDITVEEFRDLVVESAISAGIAAPIFFLIFIAVLALFPELAVLLSAPAAVAGFNALLGVSIAVPIIQSLMRHLEAGGFGEDVTESYQNFMSDS